MLDLCGSSPGLNLLILHTQDYDSEGSEDMDEDMGEDEEEEMDGEEMSEDEGDPMEDSENSQDEDDYSSEHSSSSSDRPDEEEDVSYCSVHLTTACKQQIFGVSKIALILTLSQSCRYTAKKLCLRLNTLK